MSINKAIDFLTVELDKYFDSKKGIPKDYVINANISALHDQPGGGGNSFSEKVIISLINIEEDRILKNPENIVRSPIGLTTKNPRIFLNLYVLFAANRSVYLEALNDLSLTIRFFQLNNFFDHLTHPGLDNVIEKLVPELVNMNFEQLNHLWAMLGGKYLPSVLYKMRLVPIDENATAPASPITQIIVDSKLKFQE